MRSMHRSRQPTCRKSDLPYPNRTKHAQVHQDILQMTDMLSAAKEALTTRAVDAIILLVEDVVVTTTYSKAEQWPIARCCRSSLD
jgi:hypothetical protein